MRGVRATTSRSPKTEGPEPGAPSAAAAGASSRNAWVEVGHVERRHRPGAIRVRLYGDDPANLLRARRIRLDGDPGRIEYPVQGSEPAQPAADGSARVWLSLDVDDPASWRGAGVEIRALDLAPLPEGEYYWRDLIGLECRDEAGRSLGRLHEIWPTGAHDVLVVRSEGQELLVPALAEVIVRVEPEARRLTLRLPEGVVRTRRGGA